MFAGADKDNLPCSSVNFIDQKPVRLNMTIPMAFPVSGKWVVMVLDLKRLLFNKFVQHALQFLNILSLFHNELIIAFKLLRISKVKHYAFIFSKKSSTLS